MSDDPKQIATPEALQAFAESATQHDAVLSAEIRGGAVIATIAVAKLDEESRVVFQGRTVDGQRADHHAGGGGTMNDPTAQELREVERALVAMSHPEGALFRLVCDHGAPSDHRWVVKEDHWSSTYIVGEGDTPTQALERAKKRLRTP